MKRDSGLQQSSENIYQGCHNEWSFAIKSEMWIELSLEQDTLFVFAPLHVVFSPLQFQVANLSASWPETCFPSTHWSTLPTLPGKDAHTEHSKYYFPPQLYFLVAQQPSL